MTPDEASRILQECVDKVGEHFDCLVIMGSWVEPQGTELAVSWSGNYYAAKGMAEAFEPDWMERTDATEGESEGEG